MRKSIVYGLTLVAAMLLLNRCQKLDLTADYKDITISYGILNEKDNVHYFKIYRGYITDQNAYVEAGNWDQIYYPVDSIEVRLEEYSNGKLVRSAVLDTTTVIPKESGFFHNPKQLLYYSNWQLDQEKTYRLVIHRNSDGQEVYAETMMVHGFSIINPKSSWNMNLNQPYRMKFYSGENAAFYDIFLDFYYIEVDNQTGAVEHKKLTKKLNGDYIRATNSSDMLYTGFTPETFFNTLIQTIETNPNVTRYIDSVDGKPYFCMRLTVWGGDKNYLTYREVASPSSSIVSNRMEYTNFVSEDQSAYGVLASRNFGYVDLMMSSSEHNEDTLVLSNRTKRLNFRYYRESPEFPNQIPQ